MLFVAGALGHPIKQHCHHVGQDLYNVLVPPCSCAEELKCVLHVLWVDASGGNRAPNHLVPLIACTGK